MYQYCMAAICMASVSAFLVAPSHPRAAVQTIGRRPFASPINIECRKKKVSSSSMSSSSSSVSETASVIVPSDWKDQILQKLSKVIDPDLNNDIVSLGFIKNLNCDPESGDVSFDVELTTPACPIKEQFQTECKELVQSLQWTSDNVQVTMTAPPPASSTGDIQGMARVNSVIAVSSCKGGVGKSTTAVNLAYALSQLDDNVKVGIFDADIYGPSLPTMVTPDDDAVRFVGRQIQPLQRDNVKLMSFGYVNDGSAVMRGPMVSQLLDQFLSLTYWDQIDYLILDMPPGTGDIQLTLSQRLNIDAAVIVTTPQELSFADVVRGIDMFDSVNVPCVAVVENMAYFDNDHDHDNNSNNNKEQQQEREQKLSDLQNAFVSKLNEEQVDTSTTTEKSIDDIANELITLVRDSPLLQSSSSSSSSSRVNIFGPGHKQRLSNQYGIEHTYSVPLASNIASQGDSGTPYILQYPETDTSKCYVDLAKSVAREVGKIKYEQSHGVGGGAGRLSVVYDEDEHLLRILDGIRSTQQEDENEDGTNKEEEKDASTTTTTTTTKEIGENKGSILTPAELRRECKCAACVEELTGKQILIKTSIPEDVRPLQMEPCGNYALSVDWSDGHRSLYPYRQIRSLIEEKESGNGDVVDSKKKKEEEEVAV